MVINKEDIAHPEYTLHRKGGRNIIERCPVFSPDGESLAVIVENIVRVYNINTGDCIRSLETDSSINELVSIQFPEDENYNLYGCSDEGTVIIWTWHKGAVLREIVLKLPREMKIVTFNLINSKECFITGIQPSKKNLYLATYFLKTGEIACNYPNTNPMYYSSSLVRVSLGWCNGDRYAAITNSTKVLFIQNLTKPHIRTEINNYNNLRIVSVAAHCSESSVAITDTLGVTTIIRGYLFDYKSVAREVLHWHHLIPFAVCFSVRGNYLYTGGMENVLLKWHIGDLADKAQQKSMIPRLPGMIRFISTNNTHVAVSLSNNSIVIVNSQMRVASTILECGGLSPVAHAIGPCLVYHKLLDSLLLSGRSGYMQLYSTSSDKVLYDLDITETNRIPPSRNNLLPLETEVSCAAVSGTGNWLVTCEYRYDGINHPEEKLKFWHLQMNKSTPFKLNTCVNLSHGGFNVVSIALNHNGEFCVTAGADQMLGVWKRVGGKKIGSWENITKCYYSSYATVSVAHDSFNCHKNIASAHLGSHEEFPYMKAINRINDIVTDIFNVHKRNALHNKDYVNLGRRRDPDLEMGGVAISQDGSLIAAWFGCKLTLWDTYICSWKTTLSHPMLRPKGVDVKFGSDDSAHYLVCTTEKCLAVWNLLSMTVKWLVQLNPSCLAADPFSNNMVVVTTDNDVHVFCPQKSTPISSMKRILEPEAGIFKQCTFGSMGRIYLTKNNSELYCLDPKSEHTTLEVIQENINMPTTKFAALLAEQSSTDVRELKKSDLNAFDQSLASTSAITKFISAAPHMVPSVSRICTAFLEHLSGRVEDEDEKEVEKEEDVINNDDTSDEEMQTETTVVTKEEHNDNNIQFWTPNFEKINESKLKKIVNETNLDLQRTANIFGV